MFKFQNIKKFPELQQNSQDERVNESPFVSCDRANPASKQTTSIRKFKIDTKSSQIKLNWYEFSHKGCQIRIDTINSIITPPKEIQTNKNKRKSTFNSRERISI